MCPYIGIVCYISCLYIGIATSLDSQKPKLVSTVLNYSHLCSSQYGCANCTHSTLVKWFWKNSLKTKIFRMPSFGSCSHRYTT